MTLCPIAIAVGCKRCPAFAICPVKTIIGDYRPTHDAPSKPHGPKAKAASKHAK